MYCSMCFTEDPTKTLFIKQLSFSTTVESLSKAFKGASSVRIITNPVTEKSRGYLFTFYVHFLLIPIMIDFISKANKHLNYELGIFHSNYYTPS